MTYGNDPNTVLERKHYPYEYHEDIRMCCLVCHVSLRYNPFAESSPRIRFAVINSIVCRALYNPRFIKKKNRERLSGFQTRSERLKKNFIYFYRRFLFPSIVPNRTRTTMFHRERLTRRVFAHRRCSEADEIFITRTRGEFAAIATNGT